MIRLLVRTKNWPKANLHVTKENKSFKKTTNDKYCWVRWGKMSLGIIFTTVYSPILGESIHEIDFYVNFR